MDSDLQVDIHIKLHYKNHVTLAPIFHDRFFALFCNICILFRNTGVTFRSIVLETCGVLLSSFGLQLMCIGEHLNERSQSWFFFIGDVCYIFVLLHRSNFSGQKYFALFCIFVPPHCAVFKKFTALCRREISHSNFFTALIVHFYYLFHILAHITSV